MKIWRRLEPTKVKLISYRTIVTKTFRLPDGSIQKFGTMYPEGNIDVATIALTTKGEVLVFRQYRPGPEQIMDELPGGDPEPGIKDIKSEAMRELIEETGYRPGRMKFLGRINYDAYSNSWRHYFLATDCIPHQKGWQPDQNEANGEVAKISIDQLIANAKSGKLTDSGAILLAYDELIKLKRKFMK